MTKEDWDKGPPEPTGDQCNANAKMPDFAGKQAFACWYPQMGGYCGKAVVLFYPSEHNDCFDVFVWHDGDFPFSERDGSPAMIHHCSAGQFVRFGKIVAAKQGIEIESSL